MSLCVSPAYVYADALARTGPRISTKPLSHVTRYGDQHSSHTHEMSCVCVFWLGIASAVAMSITCVMVPSALKRGRSYRSNTDATCVAYDSHASKRSEIHACMA